MKRHRLRGDRPGVKRHWLMGRTWGEEIQAEGSDLV